MKSHQIIFMCHGLAAEICYPLEVMLICVHWYAAYPLSLRHIEELMEDRGVVVDPVRST